MPITVGAVHDSLTSIFTPPSTCTDSVAYAGIWPDTASSLRPVLQAVYPQSSACFAPGWTSASTVYGKGANFWTGSPMCPSGQTIAQTFSDSTRTTGICCSSGWGNVFTNGNIDGTKTYSFFVCQTAWTSPATTTVNGWIQSGGIVVASKNTVYAPGILESTVEYMFVYNSLTSASSSTSTATSAATPASTSTSSSMVLSTSSPSAGSTGQSTASPTSTSVPPTTSKGLSAGAIAGICVGAALILLLAALGGYFVWKRRHNKQAPGRTGGPWGEKTETQAQSERMIAELPSQYEQPPEINELPGTATQRYHGSKPVYSYGRPVELGG